MISLMKFLLLAFIMSCTSVVTARTTPATIECGEQGDCTTVVKNCTQKCGCDQIYYYNSTLDLCMFNYEYFYENITEKYNIPEKIRVEADKAFNGIIISAMLFVSCCAALCISACFYCCRIDYTDHKLDQDIEALEKKLKRDGKFKKSMIKKPLDPIAENCSAVCGGDFSHGDPGMIVM